MDFIVKSLLASLGSCCIISDIKNEHVVPTCCTSGQALICVITTGILALTVDGKQQKMFDTSICTHIGPHCAVHCVFCGGMKEELLLGQARGRGAAPRVPFHCSWLRSLCPGMSRDWFSEGHVLLHHGRHFCLSLFGNHAAWQQVLAFPSGKLGAGGGGGRGRG